MGGANCICSDKTGTLTRNEMHLVEIWNRQGIEVDQVEKIHDLAQAPYNVGDKDL